MPATLSTDVLPPRQLAFIAERLPEPPCAMRPERTAAVCEPTGIPWDPTSAAFRLPLARPRSPRPPPGVTHWRRLRNRHRRLGYRRVWHSLPNFLVQRRRLDRSLVILDGTLIPSRELTEQTGNSGKHRLVGTKLSLLVDRAGAPLAVSVVPGSYHDGGLGFLTVANISRPPPIPRDVLPDAARTAQPTLLADKGYDSLRFRQFLHDRGFRPRVPTTDSDHGFRPGAASRQSRRPASWTPKMPRSTGSATTSSAPWVG